jgi:hypothetical protein
MKYATTRMKNDATVAAKIQYGNDHLVPAATVAGGWGCPQCWQLGLRSITC